MAKYNYVFLDDVPENVMDFYWATSRNWENECEYFDPGSIDLTTVKDVNEFLNDLADWYSSQEMNIEDFINV